MTSLYAPGSLHMMEVVLPDFTHDIIDNSTSLSIIGLETDSPFVALDSHLIFRARYERIRGHDHFRQWLSETPRAIQSTSPLRPHSPLQPSSPQQPEPTTTAHTASTTATTATTNPTKKRSRVANRGDAFPSEVQVAHDEHELQEQFRRDEELARASAAAARDPDDDVDDKVAVPNNASSSKRPRKANDAGAGAKSTQQQTQQQQRNGNDRRVADNEENENGDDGDVDGDEDDDKQSGDESADSSLASDELDDGRQKYYVGIPMGVSTIRLICEPSSLRELQQIHGANALVPKQPQPQQ